MSRYTESSYTASLNGPRKSSSHYSGTRYSRTRGEIGMQSTQNFATQPVWKKEPDRDPHKAYRRRKTIVEESKSSTTRDSDDVILSEGLRWNSGRSSVMGKEEQRRKMELHYPGISRTASASGVSKSMSSSKISPLRHYEMGSSEYDRKQKLLERAMAARDASSSRDQNSQAEWSSAYRDMLRR